MAALRTHTIPTLATPVITLLACLLASTPVNAGKLGGLRNKARSSTATEKSEEQSSSPRTESKRESSSRETRRQPEPSRRSVVSSPRVASTKLTTTRNNRRPSASTSSKLNTVRSRVRQAESRRATPVSPNYETPTPPRRHDRQPRRPRRSPRGISAGIRFGAPAFVASCPPHRQAPLRIVEEHHYYPAPVQPIIVEETIIDPLADAPPPVIPPSPETNIIAPAPVALPTAVAPNLTHDVSACEPTSTEVATVARGNDWINPYHIRFEIDYANDKEDVTRMGFGLLANFTRGLGIDTGMRLFREKAADFRDHLWIGDLNIVYELSATEFARTRAGVGFNFLSDSYGAEAGLNLTIGTDIFAGPVTFTGEADFGTLGDADLFHGRVSAALRCSDHLETFVGYDHLDIGGVEFSGVLAGVRFRY